MRVTQFPMSPVSRPPTPAVDRVQRLRDVATNLPLCRASMRGAFEAGHFEIAYQPIFQADHAGPAGCEALLRWNHPDRGPQDPRQFVPVLERSQLLGDVGDWLLDEAIAQLQDWERQGLPALDLAVNAAPVQVCAADFAARVEAILQRRGFEPERLTIEITHDALLDHPDVAAPALGRLARLGVGIQLDDFSGGPSMFGRLGALSLGGFKLDRRFIEGIDGEASASRDDVRVLAALARNSGLRCVAEGVQTEDEFGMLQELGLTEFQGHLFCTALPPDEFETYLHAVRTGIRGGTART